MYRYSVKNASDIYVPLNLTCKLKLDFISEISVKKKWIKIWSVPSKQIKHIFADQCCFTKYCLFLINQQII